MDIKLIALDLDGTLLDPQKRVTDRTKAALDAAAARGIHIVPATGRSFHGMPAPVLALPYLRYAIIANGADVYDAKEERSLHQAHISLDLAMEIFDFLDQWPVAYDAEIDSQGYMDRHWHTNLEAFIPNDPVSLHWMQDIRTPVDDFRGFLRAQNRALQKIQFYLADVSRRPGYIKTLQSRFPETAVSFALPNNVEINARDGVKGAALRHLCSHLGISLEQAAAFGDGLNDVSLLETAGVGIAMENASPEAKAAARYHTASNQDDGVARFIEQHILK